MDIWTKNIGAENNAFYTPEGESISATSDSNPYQPELQPSTPVTSSLAPYDGLPSLAVSEGFRVREEGGWGEVSHYRDTFIGGER